MKKTFAKKIQPAYILFITFVLLSSVFSFTNRATQPETTITITIPMYPYHLTQQGDYHSLLMDNYGSLLIPGQPNLPAQIYAFALPPDATLDTITYETPHDITLPGTYNIAPAPQPMILSKEQPTLTVERKQTYTNNYQTTYATNTPYPATPVEFIRTAGYRQYNLVDVRITPFTYYPESGILIHHQTITVTITYKQQSDHRYTLLFDNLKRPEQTAQDIIYNYDQAQHWYTTQSTLSKGLHDYVIITLDSLTTAVQPLVDWETTKGRTVEVVTTSWIASNYQGYDLAEKIRNFLRDKYPSEQWGIEDVLLVGHYDDVPMRRCWQDLGYGKPETDYYYAELSLPDSESWDKDGDRKYGENSDPIDFYNEVNVGRIPWSDATTVQHICEKSVAYEQNQDPTFKQNMLLLGAFFWDNDPNPRTDNAVLMEYKTNTTLHTWMDDWMRTRMYEQGYSTYPMDYDLRFNNVKNIWSQGKFGFVNWAGHGSPFSAHIYHSGGDAFVSTTTCNSLNDNYPSIIFADACSNADTDELNIGQAMLKRGAVGFIGATKVALGCPGWKHPNYGSSQSMDYYFTTYVTSGEYTQGQAHQKALREMYTKNLWSSVKYEMFEWGSLWGNPNLGMGAIDSSNPPATPAAPNGPTQGFINEQLTFNTASLIDPDSDQMYICWSFGDKKIEWHGPFNSGATSQVTHQWTQPGTYAVKIKTRDAAGTESSWSTPLSITIRNKPLISIGNITGGLRITTVIKNIGTTEVPELTVNISCTGGIFKLLDKTFTKTIVNLSVGEETMVSSGILFGFGPVSIAIYSFDQLRVGTAFIVGPIIFKVQQN